MGQWREEGADILLQHQARFVLNSALVTDAYMALCLSVTSWCSVKTAERIGSVFGTTASFHISHTVLYGISGIFKNEGTSI